ncbi:MAG: hypothetical protein NVSMB9_16410 [Isosphaeraceae bacterium]
MIPVIPKRRFRYRIWWLMGLIGVFAVCIAPVISPFDSVALLGLLIVLGTFMLLALYVILAVVPYYFLIRHLFCPECGERQLFCSRLTLFWPPLLSFHLCRECGARFARWCFGEWRHAKGP